VVEQNIPERTDGDQAILWRGAGWQRFYRNRPAPERVGESTSTGPRRERGLSFASVEAGVSISTGRRSTGRTAISRLFDHVLSTSALEFGLVENRKRPTLRRLGRMLAGCEQNISQVSHSAIYASTPR
jgi:hypothetical protein